MKTQRGRTLLAMTACLLAVGALSACSMVHGPRRDTDRAPGQSRDSGSSEGGFSLFGRSHEYGHSANPEAGQIGVNSYLWRATLDTLHFMPLASADPFGGVIITDWYSEPATPNERFKATVYILDTHLRADALNVSLFRQTQSSPGVWADAGVDPATEVQLENAILTKARQLRLSTLGN
jgi:hypothetical protein